MVAVKRTARPVHHPCGWMKTASASPSPSTTATAKRAPLLIIVQTVGATTEKAFASQRRASISIDFVGPLGQAPTKTECAPACVVGGGVVGHRVSLPWKKFHDRGAESHAVVGFKSKDGHSRDSSRPSPPC